MNVFFATLARLIDIKNGPLRQEKKLPEELLSIPKIIRRCRAAAQRAWAQALQMAWVCVLEGEKP